MVDTMPVKAGNALEGLPVPLFSSRGEVVSELHSHLRGLIFNSELPAGTELNQADLARRYNISRTPVREAFRLLQQEGLIDVQANQRATVRQLYAQELDQLYAVRIALESLGARITAGMLTDDEVHAARTHLEAMDVASEADDLDTWVIEHRHFHELCSARADEPLARIIRSYAERSERYLRVALVSHLRTSTQARAEHERILEALVVADVEVASALVADHLAGTARGVLRNLGLHGTNGAVEEAMAMAGGASRPSP